MTPTAFEMYKVKPRSQGWPCQMGQDVKSSTSNNTNQGLINDLYLEMPTACL